MPSPIIDIQDLSYTYPDGTPGLAGISLQIFPRDFVILAGHNGSGKSTLLRHFNALIPSSRVRINGTPSSTNIPAVRQRVGMVFQDADTQIVAETVFDDVAFGLENLKIPADEIRERVHMQLEAIGLSSLQNRHPSTLSGGEKRKLALAGILVMNPEILVFDEPFSNLDYPSTRMLMELIQDLHHKGHTLIIAAHDLTRLMGMANRMIIMEKGSISKDAPIEDLADQLEAFGINAPFDKTG
ncbi:MAG: ABC transporter ATP-binding protein [Desulfobacteraceae bacterium]|nr:MAG: ABC transporter ATP-binding protein [Desulfobacteraceae bacterium]